MKFQFIFKPVLFGLIIVSNLISIDNRIVDLSRLGLPNANIDIDETETFTQETFKELIDQKHAIPLPYILARVISSQGANNYVHYFDAHSINSNIWGVGDYQAGNPINWPNYAYARLYQQGQRLRNPINRQPITEIQYFSLVPNAQNFNYLFTFTADQLRNNTYDFNNYAILLANYFFARNVLPIAPPAPAPIAAPAPAQPIPAPVAPVPAPQVPAAPILPPAPAPIQIPAPQPPAIVQAPQVPQPQVIPAVVPLPAAPIPQAPAIQRPVVRPLPGININQQFNNLKNNLNTIVNRIANLEKAKAPLKSPQYNAIRKQLNDLGPTLFLTNSYGQSILMVNPKLIKILKLLPLAKAVKLVNMKDRLGSPVLHYLINAGNCNFYFYKALINAKLKYKFFSVNLAKNKLKKCPYYKQIVKLLARNYQK